MDRKKFQEFYAIEADSDLQQSNTYRGNLAYRHEMRNRAFSLHKHQKQAIDLKNALLVSPITIAQIDWLFFKLEALLRIFSIGAKFLLRFFLPHIYKVQGHINFEQSRSSLLPSVPRSL